MCVNDIRGMLCGDVFSLSAVACSASSLMMNSSLVSEILFARGVFWTLTVGVLCRLLFRDFRPIVDPICEVARTGSLIGVLLDASVLMVLFVGDTFLASLAARRSSLALSVSD